MAQIPPFEVSIRCSEFAVREGLRQIIGALGPLELDKEEAGTVELVLAEALNNIVEHAHSAQHPDGCIEILCWHKVDGLHLQISDRGKEMSSHTPALGKRAPLDVSLDALPEGGFGWFLIHDLAKDILYQRVNSENRLSMRLAVGLDYPCDC